MRKEPETIKEAQNMLRKYRHMLEEALADAAKGRRNKTTIAKIKKAYDYYTDIIPKMTQEKRVYKKVSTKIKSFSHDRFENQDPTHIVVDAEGMGDSTDENTTLFTGTKRQCESYVNNSGLITLKIVRYE